MRFSQAELCCARPVLLAVGAPASLEPTFHERQGLFLTLTGSTPTARPPSTSQPRGPVLCVRVHSSACVQRMCACVCIQVRVYGACVHV